MKKTSKVLSFIISSAMAMGVMGSLSADAWSFISPDGSVVDTLDTEKGEIVYRIVDGTSGDDWYDKSGCCYQRYSNFAYNCLEVKLND